jgi:crossover junction endodeoxyribonuclease RuvC
LRYEGNSFEPLEYGCVETDAKTSFAFRLLKIHDSLAELIDRHAPDAVAVETLFFNKNAKTAIEVAQGRGAALLAAARLGVEVAEYTPPQVKMAVTGYGRADKSQMQFMVKTILGLPAAPKPDDVADALAVAICHAHSYKWRGLTGGQ